MKQPPHDNNKVIPISKYLSKKQSINQNSSETSISVKDHLKRLIKDNFPKKSRFTPEDQKAIDSEDAFVARFGFSMGRKKRKALFELMEVHDFSDKEVKSIQRIGSFDWDGKKLNAGVTGWVFMQGFAQLGIVLKYALIFAVLIVFFEQKTVFQHFLSIVMFLAIVALGALTSHLYLTPYRIIQQRVQLNCKNKPLIYRLRQLTVCHLNSITEYEKQH